MVLPPSLCSLTLAMIFVAACGSERPPPPPPDANGDGAIPDAGPPTACELVAGEPEPGACYADRHCDGVDVCRRPASAVAVDGEAAALSCGEANVGLESGARCTLSDECASGLCVAAGTCREPCAQDSDCDAADRCTVAQLRTGAGAMQSAFVCVPWASAPPGVAVERELGADTFAAGVFNDHLAVPGGAGHHSFITPCGARVEPRTLRSLAPSAALLYDVGRLSLGETQQNTVAFLHRPLTVLVPNGPDAVLEDAGYDLEVRADGAGAVERITARREVRGSVLDLDLFYVDLLSLEPEGERGPEPIRVALEGVEAIFAESGVVLGEVRQHEVVGELAARLAILDIAPDFTSVERDELFRLSAGAPGPSIAVFFVRSMSRGVLGFSGGIPGPQVVHGLEGSGIVIALDLVLMSTLDLDTLIAHELGHFFGLFHTSELFGFSVEPLPDTPTCGLSEDASGDGLLDLSECAEHGADNLMFWSAEAEARGLSPQQQDVIGGGVVLR